MNRMNALKYLPISYVYVQGLSLLNPMYVIVLGVLKENARVLKFKGPQIIILGLLLMCQIMAIAANPHPLPLSVIGTVIGLLLLCIDIPRLASFVPVYRKTHLALIRAVIVLYFIDALRRLPYIRSLIDGWPDYELREAVKKSTLLADDTNTLAIRLLLIAIMYLSYEVNSRRRIWTILIAAVIMASCYSRAGLVAFAAVALITWRPLYRLFETRRWWFRSIVAITTVSVCTAMSQYDYSTRDSSVISKYEIIYGSIEFWKAAPLFAKTIGVGYFANIDVGRALEATGHSVIYYVLVELGLAGGVLLVALMAFQARRFMSEILVTSYLLLGISIFRFDFAFLCVALMFTEAYNPDPHAYSTTVPRDWVAKTRRIKTQGRIA